MSFLLVDIADTSQFVDIPFKLTIKKKAFEKLNYLFIEYLPRISFFNPNELINVVISEGPAIRAKHPQRILWN